MSTPLLTLAQYATGPAQDPVIYRDGAESGANAGSGTGSGLPGEELFASMFERLDILFHPEELLDALATLPLLAASVIVVVGVLCVLNGYQWHKWVVAVLAFICGLGLGYKLSETMGRSMVVAASVGCLCAIVATPLLRLTVAIFGGITGAFIGANAWTAFDASPADAHWAGATIGFIVIAMASLLMFRMVIVLFTSVGGAAMVVFGGITLLMQVPEWEHTVRSNLQGNQLLIPLLLLVAAVSGFVVQESRLRSHGVSILANDRGGGGED
ncbi:MAG: hypothetical protein HKO59_01220 [Phycisphaerales bacterium]|nr:hypothetical protein [Phycisphaerales bacterium]